MTTSGTIREGATIGALRSPAMACPYARTLYQARRKLR
jgi:hypothetical protein